MFEYACFWHPDQKGDSLKAKCGICGRTMDTPLLEESRPARIAGRIVEGALGRGFYGAVYLVHSERRTDLRYAIKVTPKAFYRAKAEGGIKSEGKSIDAEIDVHVRMVDLPAVAQYIRDDEEILMIDGTEVDCHWIEMQYADGPSLTNLLDDGPGSMRQVGQIAIDLLSVLSRLNSLPDPAHHNDLHADNIKVTRLASPDRSKAVDPWTQVKVFDWGSVAGQSRSVQDPRRLGDARHVADHVLALIHKFQTSTDHTTTGRPDAERRFSYLLTDGILTMCRRDAVRPISPEDMDSVVRLAFKRSMSPTHVPEGLAYIGAHYNATTLDPALASQLLVDPGRAWEQRISAPDPLVIMGMRGCGKTHLLKSFAWAAKLADAHGLDRANDPTASTELLAAETFVGLYLTCDFLSRLKPPTPQLRCMVLAYAHEAIKMIELSGAYGVGILNEVALGEFVKFLKDLALWLVLPDGPTSLAEVQTAIGEALFVAAEQTGEDTGRQAFQRLAQVITPLLDVWNGKIVYFLLDDVSRYLLDSQVSDLLTTILVRNPRFAFKVSAETLTLLASPSGAPAMSGRDYSLFDLGELVLKELSKSPAFVMNILDKRMHHVTDRTWTHTTKETLGSQKIEDISRKIAALKSNKEAAIYWGVESLAGMCTGDIGDIVTLYSTMLEQATKQTAGVPIDPKIQHRVSVDYSRAKEGILQRSSNGLALHAHSSEFAKAAHNRLVYSQREGRARLVQASEIQLDMSALSSSDKEQAQRKLDDLIKHGVFVVAPEVWRSKQREGSKHPQMRLLFNKLLGLGALIPLGKRGRFELPYKDYGVLDWLDKPDSTRLLPRTVQQMIATGETSDDGDMVEDETGGEDDTLVLSTESANAQLSLDVDPPEGLPKNSFGQKIRVDSILEVQEIDWSTTHVIGAYGFEDRCVGVWSELQALGCKPVSASMVSYPIAGHRDAIDRLMKELGVISESVNVDPAVSNHHDVAGTLVAAATDRTVLIDTTALTKPLIFELVRSCLDQAKTIYILHANAESYEPSDEDLERIISRLHRWPDAEVRHQLEVSIQGESDYEETQKILSHPRDPGAPNALAIFVPIKFGRVERVLEDVRADVVVTLASKHSAGLTTVRSRVVDFLAKYYSMPMGAHTYDAPSVDIMSTYELLLSQYNQLAMRLGHNFDLALTGGKLHTVTAGMLAATSPVNDVYYVRAKTLNPTYYSKGFEKPMHCFRLWREYEAPKCVWNTSDDDRS